MGAWGLAVNVLLPVPLVFLVMLSVPTPQKVQGFILKVCKSTLALPALGVFTIFHMGIFISACAFAVSIRSTYITHQRYMDHNLRDGLSPNEKTQQLADKWRHERNFWISAMCVLLWVVLSRMYVVCKHNVTLREQVKEIGYDPRPEEHDPKGGFARIPGMSGGSKADTEKSK